MVSPIMMKAARELAHSYVTKNLYQFGIFFNSQEDLDHCVDIIQSCLQTKHKFGYEGGSAVQAIVNNDLRRAFECADHVVRKSMVMIVGALYTIGLYEIEGLVKSYSVERETGDS